MSFSMQIYLDGTNDVVFVASDQFSSKANSIPMSIQVVGIEFVVDAPEDSRYQK